MDVWKVILVLFFGFNGSFFTSLILHDFRFNSLVSLFIPKITSRRLLSLISHIPFCSYVP